MSPFVVDAWAVGLKEGVKLASVWLVFWPVAVSKGKGRLMAPFLAGVISASFLMLLSLFVPPSLGLKDFVSKLIGYVFFLFFAASLAALYQSGGLNLFGPLRGVVQKKGVLAAAVFVSAIVYFAPDIIGSSMFVREIGEMKDSLAASYISAASGFAMPVVFIFFFLRSARGGAAALRLSKLFGVAQFLLFFSVVKLVGGGIKGFAELSLIPSVQRGIMKFVHDAVHQVLVFLMVPDHPILQTTVWNFIGIFFGPNFAIWAVLVILLSPMMIFLHHSLIKPIPEPDVAGVASLTGARRRTLKAEVRAQRRARAVPVIAFVAVVLVMWFSGRGDEGLRLYNPSPKPVVQDNGVIVIPLTSPTMDLMDGRLHKFSLLTDGETITIMAVKKPDGKLSVCLDACEVCPPDGYAQSEGHVVCIYCLTPIPIETLGRPGGCNPIPLDAVVTARDVRLDVQEIKEKWRAVKAGETKGEVK